jgi:hypothetical protein
LGTNPTESTTSFRDEVSATHKLGFGAWRIACDKNKPAAPDALKVMCAKNFSTPAKSGIMPEVSEND